MKLKLTLHQPGAAQSERHLLVTADATSSIGDLAQAIATSPDFDGHQPGGELTLRASGSDGSEVLDAHQPIVDSGLRSGARIELSSAADRDHRREAGGVLTVVEGPDKGMTFQLPSGSVSLGRATDCDIRLSDPLVSKHHATINVGRRVEILDTNSANGVLVGNVRVERAHLGLGDVAVLGSTHLTVASRVSESGTTTDITFTRSPRVVSRPQVVTVEMPTAPSEQDRPRFPMLALMMPVVMGAALFAVTRSPLSLVMVALAPVMLIGNFVDQRVQGRRRHSAALSAFDAELAQAEDDLQRSFVRERAQLESLYPALDACLSGVTLLNDLVWSRRPEHPEFLQVRLGVGSIAPSTRTDRVRAGGMPEHVERAREVAARFSELESAPVVADLRSVGGVGLAGGGAVVAGVARAVVAQAAILHSPSELVLACLTSTHRKPEWAWMEWLPHTSSPHSPIGDQLLSCDDGTGRILLDRLEELIALRSQDGRPSARGPLDAAEKAQPPIVPAVLVVADDPSADLARLTRIAELGPDAGVYVFWICERRGDIPAAARTFLDLADSQSPRIGMVRTGTTVGSVHCESLDRDAGLSLARRLAPLIDAGAPVDDDTDLPRAVPVVSVLGAEASDDPELVLTRWRENRTLVARDGSPHVPVEAPASLRALVGHTGAEPMALDLRLHGPHALVGGTTGAGKSEFLQAWVLGLAHATSPDRVTFLFVDYKGGAAFARCVDLPHTVGLVTDLSPYLVRRALRSLRAELRHREHLFNAKGVKDIIDFEKTGDPSCPPSLVIVVDEFAALASEVPEFVEGVVDVAQRGRSLGLHLILATQRPAGVIKDNLRANTNLRVALRMADEADSRDVLETPMAAHFDPAVPGRGAVKTGAGRITQFQSAFPGSRTPAVPQASPIEIVEVDFGSGRQWRAAERRGNVSTLAKDIDRIVETVSAAARAGQVAPPRKPWLDALAESYSLELLPQRRDTEIVMGVLDDPDNQRQVAEHFRPDTDGNVLYVGTGGSGKTTALRSLALAASITPRSGPVHVYGLDFAGGGLGALDPMPNVGSIISGDDEERVVRLVSWLAGQIEDRAARFSAVRADSLTSYREISGISAEPRLLVLLDGFSAFRAEYEVSTMLAPTYQALQRMLVDGRSVGVHFAVTADRPAAMPTSISAAFQRKVVLRLSEEDGYLAMGVPRDILGPTSPAGRCVQVDNPQELQLAILGTEANVAAQAKVIEELAAELAQLHPQRPEPVRSLPHMILADELPVAIAGAPVLGVADTMLEPIGFSPSGPLLLSGPMQSGRSTAVRWLAESVRRSMPDVPLVHLTGRPSPLSSLDLWRVTGTGITEVGTKLEKLTEIASTPAADQPTIAIFVEYLTDFVGTPVEQELAELIKVCRRNQHLIVGEGESTTWGGLWSVITEMRVGRTGLLLQPDQQDGEVLLRTPLPRIRPGSNPPGRGFWIRGGKATKVQLPLVE